MKFVLLDEIDLNCNINIIKLFISDDKIIKLKKNKIYNFKRQIFNYEKDIHFVFNYKNIIDTLIRKLKINHDLLDVKSKEKLKNKKVILIKNTEQNYIVRKADCFNASLLFSYLLTENYIIINPEKDNFFEMTYILMNAKMIIIGEKGISCHNQIFFNLNAKIISFILNEHDNIVRIVSKSKIRCDKMCNQYYYDKINKVIESPLNITEQNIEEFKNLNL
jgi:hypothetical protein